MNFHKFDEWKKGNPKIKALKDGMQVDRLAIDYDKNYEKLSLERKHKKRWLMKSSK